MKRAALLTIAAASLLASACHFDSNSRDGGDPGPEVDRSFQVGDFTGISVAGPYDVTITTGGKPGVTAKGGENLLNETEVVVEDGQLRIRPKTKNGVRWTWRDGKASFTVTASAIQSAGIAGSGGIKIDKVAGDFSGDVAGSGDLDVGEFNGGAIKMAIAGSGDVRAKGKADSVDLSIAGSGDIDLGGVVARSADVSIAGSGSINAHATETAKVSIMGSGDVDIAGGGACEISKHGSGNVNCH